MNSHKEISAQSRALLQLMEARLAVKGRDLDQALRRAGRRLPRRVRAHLRLLADAEKQAGNPRLARQLDGAGLQEAHDAVSAHLRQIDVADLRKGRILALAGVIAFNLLMVMAGLILWLWWRGYV